MVTIKLQGYVTESHEIRAELPDWIQLPPGKVELIVRPIEGGSDDTSPGWTEAELDAMLTFHPVPADQIVTGGWEDIGITDSQEWVEQQRRKHQE
jgi:hypothetical protein